MTRRSLLLLLIAAVSSLAGCGPDGGATAPAAPPPQVRTIRLVPENVVLSTTVVGTLEPAARDGACFVAFGAEELGLEGSKAFVATLSAAEPKAVERRKRTSTNTSVSPSVMTRSSSPRGQR